MRHLLLASIAAVAFVPGPPPLAQSAPAVPIGVFFHSLYSTHTEDLLHVDDLIDFGVNTFIPGVLDQAQLDEWINAADVRDASVISGARAEDGPRLARLSRVCRLTVEAEDSFTIRVESEGTVSRVTHPDARHGIVAVGDAGNALRLPADVTSSLRSFNNHEPPGKDWFWVPYCDLPDLAEAPHQFPAPINRQQAHWIKVRLRMDGEEELPSGTVVAYLRGAHGRQGNSGVALAEYPITVEQLSGEEFTAIAERIPFYRARGDVVEFELESTGAVPLLVDRFRFDHSRADEFFGGDSGPGRFDDEIVELVGECPSDRCLATYVGDEPQPVNWEAYRHIDSVLTARSGLRALTAVGQSDKAELVRRWALYFNPAHVLADPYPLTDWPPTVPERIPLSSPDAPPEPPWHGLIDYEASSYGNGLRAALDSYTHSLVGIRTATQAAGRPMWLVLQAHGLVRLSSIPPRYRFRFPSPEEARALAFLGVAHGAKAFIHFLYKSVPSEDGEFYVGLVGPNHERDGNALSFSLRPDFPVWTDYRARWDATAILNRRLVTMVGALAGWESSHTYLADAPPNDAYVTHVLVSGSSSPTPAADVHVGVFQKPGTSPSSDARFIIVNRQCDSDPRTLDIRVVAADIARTVTNLETGAPVTSLAPGQREFSATFDPGDARLFRIVPRGE